ncbi:NADH:flavin oxidoreductase/NADH oxidase [Coniophora puteana RWD-64-598 SS2]|uniref:NADH:flavin oxidoreductase/NADH oxidase n=1 Tax=Coniophora puteana (strain RWD-64-598) TaxID=741705 RepID=A0A5M3M8P6_CONPW|nr:NADH:flavin oxidoreductase/NADH oxidase [Coniophora puteana RWD-64-598 SS2]EIW75437.1 NADH:flavin oxidoreductase/NADH oxidase [Coniophora puteana RWD-64-598 SS2]
MTITQPIPSPALFQPLRVGASELKHRVVLAPLTRLRNHASHVPGPLLAEHYAQRGSVPGTLLISEATFIAPCATGIAHAPGVWSDEQVYEWKKVTDAVHAKGSFIYCQLWALGRTADEGELKANGESYDVVGPSSIALTPEQMVFGVPVQPRPLSVPEIKEYAKLYAQAARNAVERAGFDGVEIHGASGYLPDQFLQDVSNDRTDEYGGSIENRSRFTLEVVDAIVAAVGKEHTGIRLSPWGSVHGMCLVDPIPTFSYLTTQLAARDIAYIHVVEPRLQGYDVIEDYPGSNDFIRKIWGNRPFIAAGGFKRENAIKDAEDKGGLVAFGRLYISNPDLPKRLEKNLELTRPDRSMFYLTGDLTSKGYTDWLFAEEGKL